MRVIGGRRDSPHSGGSRHEDYVDVSDRRRIICCFSDRNRRIST